MIFWLMKSVKEAFDHATATQSPEAWKAARMVAGCASVRMALDGDMFMAAQFEGVAEESKRQMLALQPKAVAA